MKAVFKKIIDLLKEKQQLHNANAEELKSKNRIGLTAIAEARGFGFYEAIEIVKQVAKGYKNGWIACSERLPEIDGNTSYTVLVCTIDGFQHMAFWCDDEKWRYCESGMIKNPMEWTEIIAWQPLPEPYQIQSSSQITNQSTWQQQTMRRFEKVE